MAINEKVREDLDEITNSSKQQDEVIKKNREQNRLDMEKLKAEN